MIVTGPATEVLRQLPRDAWHRDFPIVLEGVEQLLANDPSPVGIDQHLCCQAVDVGDTVFSAQRWGVFDQRVDPRSEGAAFRVLSSRPFLADEWIGSPQP